MKRQLRIATLGDYNKYYSYFLYGSMEGAIRCGAWFRPISLFEISYDMIYDQIDFFKPDILLCHCIFNKKPEGRFEKISDLLRKVRKKGTKIFYHMGDARHEPRHCSDISDIIDFGLVNHGEFKNFSDIWKIPCFHWPYATLYQKSISDVDRLYGSSITFTGGLAKGSEHHGARTDFIYELEKRGIGVRVYPDNVLGNSRFQTDLVSASSKVVLGFQMGEGIHLYQDVRPFQYIGSGASYWHNKHENMRKFFEPNKHYIEFDNLDDFLEKYKKGQTIKDGFEFCQKYHSTKQRMENVIDIYHQKEQRNRIYLDEI